MPDDQWSIECLQMRDRRCDWSRELRDVERVRRACAPRPAAGVWPTTACFQCGSGEQVRIGPNNGLALVIAMQGLTADEATAVWKPFLDRVKANTSDFEIIDEPQIVSR